MAVLKNSVLERLARGSVYAEYGQELKSLAPAAAGRRTQTGVATKLLSRGEALGAVDLADDHGSQAVFAPYLGVRPASIMSWEYGTRRPSGAAIKLLFIARKNPQILPPFLDRVAIRRENEYPPQQLV